jgi:hypothetical protein
MSQSQPKSGVARFLRAGLAGIAMLATGATVSTGCLDRPVQPSTPTTSNIFVDVIRQTAIDKIDLLFVIDNSISMADKQAILRDAVPQLVNRLVTPLQDPTTGAPEFKAVRDIHIGIVTSSLGGHGADFCSPTGDPNWNTTKDDHGRLIGAPGMRQGTPPTFQNLGFLAWDPDNQYGGETNAGTLINNFQTLVGLAGETGCGFEATLEAWYRFLIDPNPPADVQNQNSVSVPIGTDNDVLNQRKAFLRPDSLVAIIMLTDENDCSVADSGVGWLSSQGTLNNVPFHLPRATSICNNNPNDPCCLSCNAQNPPGNCNVGGDPECAKGGSLDELGDALNLRCWQQKRRFGIDFLYPTDRYVEALTLPQVKDRDGQIKTNPLYDTGGTAAPRDKGIVFLAGIVGVPWQDIATTGPTATCPNCTDTLNDPTRLEYKRFEDINWDQIVGDVNAYVMPQDPLMVETPDARTGTNPATGDPLAPTSSTNPQENAINGHEYNIPARNDLQYACIFQLAAPRDCSAGTGACDCLSTDVGMNKPLCQPPGGGAAGTTQYWAKGYPGLRHLQVLKDFGSNSIVASICPKIATGSGTDPNYGYNPAVGAIIDRLKEVLSGKCLPRQLVVVQDNPDTPENECDLAGVPCGSVKCQVIQALVAQGGVCGDCGAGREPLNTGNEDDAALDTAVRKKLRELGSCGGTTGVACADYCLCRILQLTDQGLAQCQAGDPAAPPGYCYIDEAIATANNNPILDNCDETEKQVLSFVGNDMPAKGSIGFIACSGKTFDVQPLPGQ